MPAIAHRAPSSPPPTAAATSGDCTPQKRKLRSDSVSTPMKWTDDGIESETFESVRKLRRSPAKDLMSSFTASQSWNARDSEQMMAVKEALHVSTAPTVVVCREDEQKKVFEFCKSGVENEKPGSLYICGCPGTGKSLSVEKVKMSLVDWAQQAGIQEPDVFTVNCTTLTNTSDIFVKILGQIQPNKRSKGSISALQLLQKLYSQKPQSSTKKMMLVIADELDYLITRDRAVLHDLFMLTTLPFSRCILIGIANAIDLADRFLPRLQSLNCKPTVITFRAYSYDQILKILQERLLELPYSVFQLQALELCARKVAGASGDMRKALCVCRSAIEMLEAELKEYSDSSDISIEERTLERLANRDAHTINRKDSDIVRIDHMALALSKTYKSPVVDTIQSLPQHQQIILCAAVKLFRGGKKDTTIGELNKSYVGICKTTLIPAVGISELSNMCMVLKDQGLLKLGQSRDEKLKRVTLKIDETDITFALQGIRFFRSCLQFESCLLKMFSFYFTRVKTRCECLGETQTQESSPPTRKRNGRTNKELSIF